MSSDGVFGTVIDYDTLAAMPEYQGKTITQADLAKVALDKHASGEYDAECMAYVENLKKGPGYITINVFSAFNATGHDLKLVLVHDFEGNIHEKSYPRLISNGQMVFWLEVNTIGQNKESSAGIVYRGKNIRDIKMDWLLTWSILGGDSNKVYNEIAKEGHYETDRFNWDVIAERLNKGGSTSMAQNDSCSSLSGISQGPVVVNYKAMMNVIGPIIKPSN